MKKSYILLIAPAIILGVLSFQQNGNSKIEKYLAKNGHRFASGSPVAKTGAPGEQNCTSCHSGTALSGASENNFILLNSSPSPTTTYLPGATYTATLTMSSSPAKKGFQSIALDGTNAMAGSFTASAFTNVTTSGANQYINHTSSSNTSSVNTWTWTWIAPATNVGDVTFYVASNKANNNGLNSGDEIYLSQHVIAISPVAGTSELEEVKTNFTAGYAPSSNSLVMNFNSLSAGNIFINLVDLNGRSVFTHDLGTAQIGENKQTIKLPSDLKNGIYVANVFVNNKAMSAKVMVQK